MHIVFTALEGLSHMMHMKYPFLLAVFPLPANLFFDVFEPIVQAYIFTMLTMVFISLEVVTHGDEEHH
jgi:F-type H+-transporting ATPase subunit a